MPRPSAPLTPERLRSTVLAYLQKHSSTVAHTRRLYGQKISRSVAEHGVEREPLVAELEAAIELGLRYGFLDDAKFAESRARRGLSRGLAPMKVQAGLAAKGISFADARAGVAAATDGDPVKEACAAYVKRKKLGPWREPGARAAAHTADLGKLARAGFPYAVARAALQSPEPEDDDSA